MLNIIGAIVVLGWILGLFFQIGGGLIHSLLVIAAVIFLFNFFTGRRV